MVSQGPGSVTLQQPVHIVLEGSLITEGWKISKGRTAEGHKRRADGTGRSEGCDGRGHLR